MSLLPEEEPNVVFADGFDEAIIGVLHLEGEVRTVYDKWAMVNIIRAAQEDWSFEDAVEFLEYNVWCSYVGPSTPIYMYCVHGNGPERKEELLDYVYDTLW